MINQDTIPTTPVFAGENDTYVDPSYKESENFTRGFEPLETLPATWYNSLMNGFTKAQREIKQVVNSLFNELKNAITYDGTPLDSTSSTQLREAIQKMAHRPIASGAEPGEVRSASDPQNVSVNPDTGVMTVNGMSDWNPAADGPSIKEWVLANVGTVAKYQFFPDYDHIRGYVSQWTDASGYSAPQNGYFLISIKSEQSVRLFINGLHLNTFASGNSLFMLPVSKGDLFNMLDSEDAQLTLCTGVWSGADNELMFRFVPLKVLSEAPTIEHAESATFLRPAGSTSERVTANDEGQLTVNTMVLKTAAEFDDGLGGV